MDSSGNQLKVRIYTAPGARLPERSTPGAAGLDVHAWMPHDTPSLILRPGQRTAVPTGLYFEIPAGYCISLRPRSGLALKNGITLVNTPATIDSDYRGELKVILANTGTETFTINHGDRICQLLLEKVYDFIWEEVSSAGDLDPSYRGEGGFGSTGTGILPA